MRTKLLSLGTGFLSVFTSYAQTVQIPDPVFKKQLVNNIKINTNSDTVISIEEARAVDTLILNNYRITAIKSLEGIEAFKNIKVLDIQHNALDSLDLSQNLNLVKLNCSHNRLTSLIVSHLVKLMHLHVSANRLTHLEVSQLPLLETLEVGRNKLSALDISHNPKLKVLYAPVNELTSINTGANPDLEELDLTLNHLSILDLTQNLKIKSLSLNQNTFTTVEVSNLTNLVHLDLGYNQLTSLNVSKLNLISLEARGNVGLSLICVKSIYDAHRNHYYKDQNTEFSTCDGSDVFACGTHLSYAHVCDDFKDADTLVAGINEYSILTDKTKWDHAGPVLGAQAHRVAHWTEAYDKNGFTAYKTRSGDGILRYDITQNEFVYEPFTLTFGTYAEADAEEKFTLNLTNDKKVSFDLKNTGDTTMRFFVQLEDIHGNSLVFDKKVGNNGNTDEYQLGYSHTWSDHKYIQPGGKSTFAYDFAHAICGITEEYEDEDGTTYKRNMPKPEIQFDYSQVALVKFFATGVVDGSHHHDLEGQSIEISNFKIGNAGLVSNITDKGYNNDNPVYKAYDLMGHFVDEGTEAELILAKGRIYILKSGEVVKKKMIID